MPGNVYSVGLFLHFANSSNTLCSFSPSRIRAVKNEPHDPPRIDVSVPFDSHFYSEFQSGMNKFRSCLSYSSLVWSSCLFFLSSLVMSGIVLATSLVSPCYFDLCSLLILSDLIVSTILVLSTPVLTSTRLSLVFL